MFEKSFFVLTIKLNRAVSVAERVLTDTSVAAEVALGHGNNCELHDDLISIVQICWLVPLACAVKEGKT